MTRPTTGRRRNRSATPRERGAAVAGIGGRLDMTDLKAVALDVGVWTDWSRLRQRRIGERQGTVAQWMRTGSPSILRTGAQSSPADGCGSAGSALFRRPDTASSSAGT